MSFTGMYFRKVAKKSDAERDAKLTAPEDVCIVSDLNYAGNKDKFNLLDVYYPKGTSSKIPVIVSIHGGGYVYGSKEIYKYYGMFMAQQGFVFVNFSYHLAPKYKFPTPLNETNLVLQWMTKHADEYHMDLNNVFMVGDSAGAQMLSQFAAIMTNPDYENLFDFNVPKEIKLRAVALNCGRYKQTLEEAIASKDKLSVGLLTDYFGRNPAKRYKNYEKMIDVHGHITSDYPPSYVMTAYYDFLKSYAQPMYEFLKEKGIDTEMKCYGTEDKQYMAHVCHVNMNLEEAKEINRDECAFFRKYIVQGNEQ